MNRFLIFDTNGDLAGDTALFLPDGAAGTIEAVRAFDAFNGNTADVYELEGESLNEKHDNFRDLYVCFLAPAGLAINPRWNWFQDQNLMISLGCEFCDEVMTFDADKVCREPRK